MRGIRVASVALGSVLCVGAVVGVVGGSRHAEAQLDQSLTARSLETAKTIEEFFERARALDLMIANTPSVEQSRLADDGGLRREDAVAAQDDSDVDDVLAYLERLFPGQIGEADVIDAHGEELVRVVRGQAHRNLKDDEDQKAFFFRALATPPGQVYQSRPFVSDDTHAWVISNATKIAGGVPGATSPVLVNFELTVDSFRRQAERGPGSLAVMIVNRDGGKIVSETGHAQAVRAPLGRPATELTRRAAGMSGPSGVISVNGRRAAYQVVRTQRGNQNHWLVVASAPDTSAPWSSHSRAGNSAATRSGPQNSRSTSAVSCNSGCWMVTGMPSATARARCSVQAKPPCSMTRVPAGRPGLFRSTRS